MLCVPYINCFIRVFRAIRVLRVPVAIRSSLAAAVLLLAPAWNASAQAKPDEPEFAKYLFAPELVLQNAQQIGLKPAQRTAVLQAIRDVQVDLMDMQLQMAEPAEQLTLLAKKEQVDEAAALALVDRILSLEREIKKKQMSLLIRIKNILTSEQQARLTTLRDRREES
jgi:Spy/CpxP family protein refolding chaperone